MYRDDVHPPTMAIREAVAIALAEDLLPLGDLSAALIPEGSRGQAAFVARSPGVVAGTRCAEQACIQVDPDVEVTWLVGDGCEIGSGGVIGRVEGQLRSLLTAERTALEFPLSSLGCGNGRAALRRSRAGGQPDGEDLGHAQDHTWAAIAREGRRESRRRGQPSRQPLRGRADQGQPPRRTFDQRGGQQGPRAVAGPHG